MRDSFNLKRYLKENPLLDEADRYATVRRSGTYDPFTGKEVEKYLSMIDPDSYKELTGTKVDATGRNLSKKINPMQLKRSYVELKRLLEKLYKVTEDPRNADVIVSKNPQEVIIYFDPGQVSATGQKTESMLEITFNEKEKNTVDKIVNEATKLIVVYEKRVRKSGSAITYSWF